MIGIPDILTGKKCYEIGRLISKLREDHAGEVQLGLNLVILGLL
jgi:hypothetical protein